MRKIWVIAEREFLAAVRRPAFWILTLGLPVFMGLIGGIAVLIGAVTVSSVSSSQSARAERVLGVFDPATLLDWPSLTEIREQADSGDSRLELADNLARELRTAIAADDFGYRHFIDEADGTRALEAQEIAALVTLPADFLEGAPAQLTLPNPDTREPSLNRLARQLRRRALAAHYDDAERIERVLNPFRDLKRAYLEEPPTEETAPKDWQAELKKYLLPILFMMLIMIAILTSSDRLLRGLMEEKQNRLIEILLSSVDADQLMAGKVLGLGIAGFVQLAIWAAMALFPAAAMLSFFDFSVVDFIILTAYFILGYFLLATCILGLGSVGSNHQEASQWTMIIILAAVTPMMFSTLLIEAPGSAAARALTYIPFSAPMAGVSRYAAGALPPWEIAASLAVIAVSGWLALIVGSKIFRVGILMTGQSPSPAALWRALRAVR